MTKAGDRHNTIVFIRGGSAGAAGELVISRGPDLYLEIGLTEKKLLQLAREALARLGERKRRCIKAT